LTDDDLDEEYDFMDESDEEPNGARRINPKLKYMRILQKIADRTASQVLINLDDLAAVCFANLHKMNIHMI
jgi:hypothetical protein